MSKEKTTFIKIDRNILDWRWYTNSNTKDVFLHLLLTANIADKEFGEITVHRGEVVTSVAKLSKELGLTVKETRVALDHLKATNEVAIKGQAKFSIISILRYDYYQSQGQGEGQTRGKQRANKGQQLKNIKNNKEGEEYIYTSADTLPIGIVIPLQDGEYEITQGDLDTYTTAYPLVDVKQEFKKAALWCESNPSKRKTLNGIKRFLTNWMNGVKPQAPQKKSWLEIAEEIENERKGNGSDI